MAKDQSICLAIIAAVAVFYLATIRPGHPWGDDFAMYISEARNIAEGIPLAETGYIYNSHYPSLGPRVYPPVFPALLLPGYWIGGVENLTPMKIEMVLFFIGALIAICWGAGKELPLLPRTALLVIVGFNPLLWGYKDDIDTAYPFMFLLFVTLLVADTLTVTSTDKSADTFPDTLDDAAAPPSKRVWRILLLAGLVYLCYGMRTVGIVLVPSLALLAFASWNRGGRSVAWAAGLGFLLCLAQMSLLSPERSYADQIRFSPHVLIANLSFYAHSLSRHGDHAAIQFFLVGISLSFAFVALLPYLRRMTSKPRIYEIFLPLYLGVVLAWPHPVARYLIPVVPLFIVYFLEGLEILRTWLRIRHYELAMASLLIVVAVAYAAVFMRSDFESMKQGIGKTETAELFAFIRNKTAPNDVIIFRKPRALALYGQRRSSVYPNSVDPGELYRYFQSIDATYLIAAPEIDDPGYDAFINSESAGLELAFRNADFRVFRLRPAEVGRRIQELAVAVPAGPGSRSSAYEAVARQ